MPEETFREIVSDLKIQDTNYIYCHLKLGDSGVEVEDYITLRRDQTIEDMTVQTGTEFVIDPDLTKKIEGGTYGLPPKILICPGKDRRASVYSELKEKFNGRLYVERTDVDRVEAMHPDVNKAKALRSICEACGVDVGDAMAIGDGSNDLSMLESAGIGALLGNADDTTKAMARDVEHVPSFQENGFTAAVDRFVFNQ